MRVFVRARGRAQTHCTPASAVCPGSTAVTANPGSSRAPRALSRIPSVRRITLHDESEGSHVLSNGLTGDHRGARSCRADPRAGRRVSGRPHPPDGPGLGRLRAGNRSAHRPRVERPHPLSRRRIRTGDNPDRSETACGRGNRGARTPNDAFLPERPFPYQMDGSITGSPPSSCRAPRLTRSRTGCDIPKSTASRTSSPRR